MIDEELIVDGEVTENVPVEEVQEEVAVEEIVAEEAEEALPEVEA